MPVLRRLRSSRPARPPRRASSTQRFPSRERPSRRGVSRASVPEASSARPVPEGGPEQTGGAAPQSGGEGTPTQTGSSVDGARRAGPSGSQAPSVAQASQVDSSPVNSARHAVEPHEERIREARDDAERLASRAAAEVKATARRVESDRVNSLIDRIEFASSALDATTRELTGVGDVAEAPTSAMRVDVHLDGLLGESSPRLPSPDSATGSPRASATGPGSSATRALANSGTAPVGGEWTSEARVLQPTAVRSTEALPEPALGPGGGATPFQAPAGAIAFAASIALLAASLWALGALGPRRRLQLAPASGRPAPFIALLTRPG